jgi:hypothetical protein
MAIAIKAMLDKVPKPGFSLRGIQRRRTTVLIAKVDHPIVISNLVAMP